MMKLLPVFLIASILFISGCTSQTGERILEDGTVVKSDGTMVKPDGTMTAPDGTMTKPDGTVVKPDGTMILPNGTMIPPENAGEEATFSSEGLTKFANNYYRYDPAAFQAALDDGKVIFLDFHADWCPICNAERPAILDGFNSISYNDIVGFQVHYNDGNTKSFDTEAIKKYQVAYQHTKIIIGKDGKVAIKTLDVFDKNRVVSEIEKARNA